MRPRHRLLDASLRLAFPEPAPVATIRYETRSVLRAFPASRLFSSEGFELPLDGLVSLRLELPAPLRGTRRVIVQSSVYPGLRWISLPARVAPVRRRSGSDFVEARLDVGRGAGRKVRLRVQGWIPIDEGRDLQETPPIVIPAKAVLEFGFGILELAWEQGAVEFSILACEGYECSPIFRETLDPGEESGRGWRDRSLPLDDYAGKRLSFRFEARHLTASAGSFTFPVWSSPTLYLPEPRGPEELNVILLSIDTLRADHLTSYGYPRDTAPFIDAKLARGGAVFENATTAASTTGASHMTMFTSLQPSVHRVRANTGVLPLSGGTLTLAELLRSHGFETAAFTENAAIVRGRGFGRGFDTYVENTSPGVMFERGQIEATFRDSRKWLERNRWKRFFLFVHTYQVHNPYTPPERYSDFFLATPPGLEAHPDMPPKWDPVLYDREIRYCDDELRDFVRGLEDEGILENTLFILTSDHGEEFLEHGFLSHGADIHQEILAVPLIFSGPGIPPGVRIEQPVGLVDLMPTILELVAVPPAPGVMGRSFAGLLRGAKPDDSWAARPLYSEAWQERAFRAHGQERIQQPTFAVRKGQRKLVRYRETGGFRYVYYDLERDPQERIDRYVEEGDAVRDLRELLDRYQETTAALAAGLGARARDSLGAEMGTLEAEREEKLRALGYLD